MNEDQYQIVPVPQGNMPIPNRMDRADFIDKIKPEALVEGMRHKLLGEYFDGSAWIKIPELQKNALTPLGAWEISNMMLSGSSINVSISKLKDEQIAARLRNLIREVMIKMLTNWREYGIKEVGQFWYVKSIVYTNALVVLSQAGGGSVQEMLKTTVMENRMVSSEKPKPSRLRRLILGETE